MSNENVRKFTADGHTLTYRQLGTGSATLLTFHGFGQNNDAFIPLEDVLGTKFTIFTIDLFFHGGSQYAGSQPLTKLVWYRLMTGFLENTE